MADRFRHLAQNSFDVVVVGAGTGGLTAAALLAKRGHGVLVVDQHYVAGGNGTVFRRKGYEFDVGLHYIGSCEPNGLFPRVLRAAGSTPVEFEELDPDGFDTLVFPDFTFRVPRGIEAFRARLFAQFPAEKKGIDRYLRLLEQLARVQKLAASPIAALWTLPRSLMLLRWSKRTFSDFLDTCTHDPKLRAVLAGQNGDYALPPSRAALLMGAGLPLHYLEAGAYYPRGGGQVLSDRLAESIEANGGKILLRTLVKRIIVEGGRATGVEIENKHLGRRTINARTVISNADLKQTVLSLVGRDHFSKETVRRVEGYEMSPALGMVYLGIRRDLVAERHPRTHYWIYGSYDLEDGYRRIKNHEFLDDPAVFVAIASVKDPTNRRIAPPSLSNVQLMSLAPSSLAAWGVTEDELRSGAYSDSAAYRAKKGEYAASLLRVAERVLPGISSQVAYQEVATPLTLHRYTLATGGTSYGIALTPEQFLGRRPGAKTEIAGLLLCGASCRTGHGIAGVMASGVVAAAVVHGKGIFRDVYGPRARRKNPVDAAQRGAASAAGAT